jgi:hypothetical protein
MQAQQHFAEMQILEDGSLQGELYNGVTAAAATQA